jgi:Domain of unknown function (DUF4262)
MTTLITSGLAPDGTPYEYTVGLTDYGAPELILLLTQPADLEAHKAAASLLAMLIDLQRQGRAFVDGEVVDIQTCGIRVQLHSIAPRADYPLTKADAQYGAGNYAIMQVHAEVRSDA